MNISITPGRTADSTVVELSGQIEEIISDKERETFKIKDTKLKEAVRKHLGRCPDDVFVKSPTPWGDAYRTYNWEQVKRTLEPVGSRVLGIHMQPAIISTHMFNNYSEYVSAKCSGGISHQVEETISSSWSVGGALTVGKEITYSLNFGPAGGGGSFGGKTNWSVTNNFNCNTTKSKKVGLGVNSSVEVNLNPEQAVQACLTGSYGTLDIEVDYEASLSGYVFANYSERYKGHRFWALPVEVLLEAAGRPNCVECTETLSIGFYSNARVEIRDM